MEAAKRIAIYARVSTKDQTAENQLRDLRSYSLCRHWNVVREFVDQGFSGAKVERPCLIECMDFLRKRQADMLLVWRFDRFARSLSHLATTLDELRQREIDFVSYSENVDTSTSQGRMVFGIMASLAEFERELIRERIFSGLRRAKEEGVELGRPNIDPDKVRQILSLQGSLAQRAIATQVGVSQSTVQRVLIQNRSQIVAFNTDDLAVGI